ncbi:MAG: BMP family ABC transporter substrate-binding protein [Clostridiales Family XIII bacterium]|jgi:basic membrane protein A|nr:BMP family ABC transporter substrate-binding protein [Clostridiales Family XIII bacterium]
MKMLKMKKVLTLMLAMLMLFVPALTACGSKEGNSSATNSTEQPSAAETDSGADASENAQGANIAFILPADDSLGINDRGWIQMTWTGVKTYGDANGKTYTWYKPLDNSTQGYYDAMTTAINDGTEVIISLGSQPVDALIQAQNDYPDTYFIAVEPSGVEEYLADNTYAMFHQADEAGFLAGVAAVRGGFKNIGILTGLDIPPMNIWSYGYIQGINYEAGRQGVTDIKVRHHYVNTSASSPEIQTLAAAWYNDGCDIIIPMMAGGNPSLFAAADAAGKPCFGGDVDQGDQSEHILTGAIKKLEETVPAALASIYEGNFPGGTFKWLNVDDDAVGLATGHWRMDEFGYTTDDYEADFEAFKSDVDGRRSGLLTETEVRTDANSDAFDALWAAIQTKNVEFTNIK